jgi:hypothetical protein
MFLLLNYSTFRSPNKKNLKQNPAVLDAHSHARAGLHTRAQSTSRRRQSNPRVLCIRPRPDSTPPTSLTRRPPHYVSPRSSSTAAQALGRRRLQASLHAKPTLVLPLHKSSGVTYTGARAPLHRCSGAAGYKRRCMRSPPRSRPCTGAWASLEAAALSSQNPSRTPPRLCCAAVLRDDPPSSLFPNLPISSTVFFKYL